MPRTPDGFDCDPANCNEHDEPRPPRERRCSECGGRGSHAQGCPEAPEVSDFWSRNRFTFPKRTTA
jgi:hypothetical protein